MAFVVLNTVHSQERFNCINSKDDYLESKFWQSICNIISIILCVWQSIILLFHVILISDDQTNFVMRSCNRKKLTLKRWRKYLANVFFTQCNIKTIGSHKQEPTFLAEQAVCKTILFQGFNAESRYGALCVFLIFRNPLYLQPSTIYQIGLILNTTHRSKEDLVKPSSLLLENKWILNIIHYIILVKSTMAQLVYLYICHSQTTFTWAWLLTSALVGVIWGLHHCCNTEYNINILH